MILSDSGWGFGLDIGFIDNLQVMTTNKYNTVTNFHNLQITRAHTKSLLGLSVFTSSFLVMASTMAVPLLPCSSPL
jgi:hypothetical protein